MFAPTGIYSLSGSIWGVLAFLAGRSASSNSPVDPRLKRVVWQLVAGTRGGPNRARILKILAERPCNANQLANELHLDYKTIQHHLKALVLNGLITSSEQGTYGALYFLTPSMEDGFSILGAILAKIGNK